MAWHSVGAQATHIVSEYLDFFDLYHMCMYISEACVSWYDTVRSFK